MSVVFIYHKNQPNCREIYQSHGSYWSKYINLYPAPGNSAGDLFWDGENVTLLKFVGDLQLGDEKFPHIESPGIYIYTLPGTNITYPTPQVWVDDFPKVS